MKVPKAQRDDVPNEIEIEVQAGTAMPATTSTRMKKASANHPGDYVEALRSSDLVGDNYSGNAYPYHYNQEDDDDDVLALRDSLEEADDTDDTKKEHKDAREETTPSHQNPKTTKCERQSAIDDISLTGDTAPTSANLMKQAMQPPATSNVGSAPSNAVSAKTAIPLPIQNLNALARNHLGDCGGLPMGMVADDELVKNMRVGVGIAGNVAGRAAKNAPGGREVIHGVKAGIAYAEETAQSAKKLISDTKQLAKDMDIKKFAASSASWSFEDDMFRLSDESGQSDDLSGSRSKSSSTKESFRYTESDETSYYSKHDDFDMETMQSSFVTENPSGIYTESIAPSAVEDLSFAPQSVISSRGRRTRNKPPKAPKRVVSHRFSPSEVGHRRLDHVCKDETVSSATAEVNICGDEDDNSEFTEVTYQSETNVDLQARRRNQEKNTVADDESVGTNANSSEYTEVTVPGDDNAGSSGIDKAEKWAPTTNDRADRAGSGPNPPPTITTADTKSPEQILADNTVDVVSVKVKWTDPPPEQAALIAAMLSTSIGRRSNACGTIKMMASNKKKAAALVRTRILVDALILAIDDGRQITGERDLHLEAQTRATIAISHLSEVKENRVLLAQHPGLIRALIDVIRNDKGEARVAACRSLVMMSKMQQNKVALVETDGFISLLADIMSGRYDQRDKRDRNDGVSVSFSSMNSDSKGESQSQSQSQGNSSKCGSMGKANSSSSRGSMTIRQCKDARYQEFLSLSRVNCCAAFSHLAKDCASSAILCKEKAFLDAILTLCSNPTSPMYKRCLEILCHLTRFSGNNEILASNGDVTKVLVTSGKTNGLDERLYALRSFQNISAVCTESRVILATDSILSLLVSAALEGATEEQEIALGTIFNLALEPGTLVNLTNTKNFTAVMINVVNSKETSPTSCHMARQILRLVAKWMNILADTDDSAHQNSVLKPTGWMLYS